MKQLIAAKSFVRHVAGVGIVVGNAGKPLTAKAGKPLALTAAHADDLVTRGYADYADGQAAPKQAAKTAEKPIGNGRAKARSARKAATRKAKAAPAKGPTSSAPPPPPPPPSDAPPVE